jgi:hypothetical protein
VQVAGVAPAITTTCILPGEKGSRLVLGVNKIREI